MDPFKMNVATHSEVDVTLYRDHVYQYIGRYTVHCSIQSDTDSFFNKIYQNIYNMLQNFAPILKIGEMLRTIDGTRVKIKQIHQNW
jgi:hypothetical protein